MSIDLRYLAYTAMLTAALWIPYILCQVTTNGFLGRENYRDPAPRPVPLWGKRADRACLNAVESFAPFAALVLVAHLTGKANSMTAFWAMAFFWLRVWQPHDGWKGCARSRVSHQRSQRGPDIDILEQQRGVGKISRPIVQGPRLYIGAEQFKVP